MNYRLTTKEKDEALYLAGEILDRTTNRVFFEDEMLQAKFQYFIGELEPLVITQEKFFSGPRDVAMILTMFVETFNKMKYFEDDYALQAYHFKVALQRAEQHVDEVFAQKEVKTIFEKIDKFIRSKFSKRFVKLLERM